MHDLSFPDPLQGPIPIHPLAVLEPGHTRLRSADGIPLLLRVSIHQQDWYGSSRTTIVRRQRFATSQIIQRICETYDDAEALIRKLHGWSKGSIPFDHLSPQRKVMLAAQQLQAHPSPNVKASILNGIWNIDRVSRVYQNAARFLEGAHPKLLEMVWREQLSLNKGYDLTRLIHDQEVQAHLIGQGVKSVVEYLRDARPLSDIYAPLIRELEHTYGRAVVRHVLELLFEQARRELVLMTSKEPKP